MGEARTYLDCKIETHPNPYDISRKEAARPELILTARLKL